MSDLKFNLIFYILFAVGILFFPDMMVVLIILFCIFLVYSFFSDVSEINSDANKRLRKGLKEHRDKLQSERDKDIFGSKSNTKL